MADAKIINYGQQINAGTTAIPDNNATALDIESTDAKDYITIDTSDTGETVKIQAGAGPGLLFEASRVRSNGGGQFGFQFEDSSSTNPVLLPNYQDQDTGVGRAAADRLSLITGGTEALRLGGGGVIGKLETALTDSGGTASVSTSGSSTALVGVNTAFTTDFHVGAAIKVGTVTTTVTAITDNNNLTLQDAINTSVTGTTCTRDGGELFAVKTGDSKTLFGVNETGAIQAGDAAADSGTTNNISIGDSDALDLIQQSGSTNGQKNIIIGHASDNYKLTTGYSNVFAGYRSGEDMTTGNRCVYIGDNAGVLNDNNHNVFVGYTAGQAATGNLSTAVGSQAMVNCTGSSSVAVGFDALKADGDADNCVAVGAYALSAATGNGNIGIGKNAGNAIVAGSSNIHIGADSDGIHGNSNQISIGADAITTAANQIMMGNHRGVDMTMDCPPITVKQTATDGAGISIEHEGSTNNVVEIGEVDDAGRIELKKGSDGTVVHRLRFGGSSYINNSDTYMFGVSTASPNSNLHVGGSVAYGVSTPSGNVTAGNAYAYHCNTASNDVTVTLPAKSGKTGRMYTFKKIHASNNMIIAGDGSETIDGSNTITFGDIYDTVTVQCGTAGWYIVSRYEP